MGVRYLKDGEDFGSHHFAQAERPAQPVSRISKEAKRVTPESYGLVNGHTNLGPSRVVKTRNETYIKPGPKAEVNRIRRASGGSIPGNSPAAGMQPMTRTPTDNPMSRATVSMPAQDLGSLTSKAVKVGAKLGALSTAANSVHERRVNPGPGVLGSPAAQPPVQSSQQIPADPRGMKRGGPVKKGRY